MIRIDELHKFSDGTLDDVQNAFNDRLKGIRMQYLPQTIWRQRNKDNAGAMVQAIDKQLKTRRIMRSLEKFVSGRPYEEHAEFDESNTNVLEDSILQLEILSRRFFLKLNLPDHRILKDGGEGTEKSTEEIQKIKLEQGSKKQRHKYTIISDDIDALVEFDQKTILFNSMTKTKKPDDADNGEGPFIRSDRGLKRLTTSKGTETSKKTSTLKESSKAKSTTISSKSSKSSKSAKDQDDELIFVQDSNNTEYDDAEFGKAEMPMDQGEDLGKTDEQLNVEAVLKNDWYKKSRRGSSPDPELLRFTMNRLQIDNLTKELLVRPVYNLLKGTCKSCVELDYNMEECYCRQITPANFFFNNDLEYLRGGISDKKYTASNTKTKATRYEIQGIEDMVPTLWSPVKIVYDRYALLGISYWRTKRQTFYGYTTKVVSTHDVYSTKRIFSIISVKVNEWYGYGHLEEIIVKRNKLNNLDAHVLVYLAVNLHMFTRRTIIQARVEDLQLGVESYQKKLNLTRPRTRDVDMTKRPAYTTLSDPQGVIYKDKLKRKRFMSTDELYKFSDVTLNSILDTLDMKLHELHLGYNNTMRNRLWTTLYQQQTRIMIKAINQKLLERRLMRSLEKFVGGRDYGQDLRLLQRTI
ncbi:hypothetical protein Tco_0914287 [Tanacetum coccineum]